MPEMTDTAPQAHFLITLFNLPLWKADKGNSPTGTRRWLERRCELFEKWCLPSVAAQSSRSFRWLVMFDIETPPDILARIDRWKETCPMLEPCFAGADDVAGFADSPDDRPTLFIAREITRRLDGTEKWLLTTNLDNDDALHRDAIATIGRLAADCPGRAVISLNDGMQVFADGGGAAMKMRYPHNHFLTLREPLEPGTTPRTIESLSHRRARRMFDVVDHRSATPMWIEVVHDGNVSNDLRLTSRIGCRPILGEVDLRPYGAGGSISALRQWAGLARLVGRFFPVAARKLRRKLNRRR